MATVKLKIGEDEGGTRNDGKKEKSLDFTIVRRKWQASPSIGHHPQLDENGLTCSLKESSF